MVNGESQTARGEPVSHTHRADHADECARDHVARMMSQKHQATEGNQKSVGDHRARARGQTALTAKARAKPVTACADGKLA